MFSYIKGFLDASPILHHEIAGSTAHEITLRNGIVIAVHSTSFRTVRGRTLVACIFDEVAYWRDESGDWWQDSKQRASSLREEHARVIDHYDAMARAREERENAEAASVAAARRSGA